MIKLRATKANTPDSLVIEMPWDVRRTSGERKPKGQKPYWRRMKMACGEVSHASLVLRSVESVSDASFFYNRISKTFIIK